MVFNWTEGSEAFPQPSKEFTLEVDASGVAVDGILSQYQDDGDCTEAVTGSPYNQEAYTMVCAVEHWYQYLTGNKFILNSDHSPLGSRKNYGAKLHKLPPNPKLPPNESKVT